MHLKALTIRNFRAIEDITVEFDSLVNVIVGPNAIGKTTILEAIRFAKGLLAPRTASETTQLLVALGATSAHTPQFVSFHSIAGNKDIPVEILCRYELSARELDQIASFIPQMASQLVQAQLGQAFGNPGAVIQYLSSPEGQAQLDAANQHLTQYVDELRKEPACRLDLIIDPQGNARGTDQNGQVVAAALDVETTRVVYGARPSGRREPRG